MSPAAWVTNSLSIWDRTDSSTVLSAICPRTAPTMANATIETIAVRMKERIKRIGDLDPVSQDILIGTTDEVEKAGWMLRSQLTI